MTLGAMVDLGVPKEYLINELKTLHINDEFTLSFEKKEEKPITINID